jgi:hypothetical protein
MLSNNVHKVDLASVTGVSGGRTVTVAVAAAVTRVVTHLVAVAAAATGREEFSKSI